MKKDFSAINDAVNDVQLNCCPRCKLIFQYERLRKNMASERWKINF